MDWLTKATFITVMAWNGYGKSTDFVWSINQSGRREYNKIGRGKKCFESSRLHWELNMLIKNHGQFDLACLDTWFSERRFFGFGWHSRNGFWFLEEVWFLHTLRGDRNKGREVFLILKWYTSFEIDIAYKTSKTSNWHLLQ